MQRKTLAARMLLEYLSSAEDPRERYALGAAEHVGCSYATAYRLGSDWASCTPPLVKRVSEEVWDHAFDARTFERPPRVLYFVTEEGHRQLQEWSVPAKPHRQRRRGRAAELEPRAI